MPRIAIVQRGRFHTPNVAVRTGHQLKQERRYRHVRHPGYLGALTAWLGFALALGNWLGVAVLMCTANGLYLYRIHEEDEALAAAFALPIRQRRFAVIASPSDSRSRGPEPRRGRQAHRSCAT